MKCTIIHLLLLNISRAKFGEWDASQICDYSTDQSFTLPNVNQTMDDCTQWCKDTDEANPTDS